MHEFKFGTVNLLRVYTPTDRRVRSKLKSTVTFCVTACPFQDSRVIFLASTLLSHLGRYVIYNYIPTG